jgi:hypothetical protein
VGKMLEPIAVIRSNVRRSVLRMLGGGHRFEIEFDRSLRIPVVDYGIRCGKYVGKRINPLHLALYACKQLNLESITGPIVVPPIKETESSEYVSRAADWLLSKETRRGRLSVWEYGFSVPPLLEAPWRSALTEAFGGLVLLVLGRTDEARRHLESMLIDYRDKGVAERNGQHLWLLEYVCESSTPSVRTPPLVLNGNLHSLLIMHECGIRLGDSALREAFEIGYQTLKRELSHFDAGFYTYYDSRKNPADEKYHRIHVELLRLLYEKTKDSELLRYLARWTKYTKMYPVLEPIIFCRHMIRSRGSLFV